MLWVGLASMANMVSAKMTPAVETTPPVAWNARKIPVLRPVADSAWIRDINIML